MTSDIADESLHVPLRMRMPGKIAPGQKPQTLISSIDVMPTILSLCGLKATSAATGIDKSSAVLGGIWDKAPSAALQIQLLDRMKRWQKDTGDVFPAKSRAARKTYEKT